MINKDAVKEIFNRDGFQAAGIYLVNHENLSNQEAIDYLHKEIMYNINASSHAPTYQPSTGEAIPMYYCEQHNDVTSPNPCSLPHGNFIQRFLNKVKSFRISEYHDN